LSGREKWYEAIFIRSWGLAKEQNLGPDRSDAEHRLRAARVQTAFRTRAHLGRERFPTRVGIA